MSSMTRSIPVACLLMFGFATANAQSGLITIDGVVSAVTCEVSFNGVEGDDVSIRLPTVPASALREGNSAGRTPVIVAIHGSDPVCGNGGLSLQMNPRRSAAVVNERMVSQALMVNPTNALVGLRDARDVLIPLSTGWVSPEIDQTGDGTEILFYAEYFANGADVIPGSFQAPLEYTLIYP